MMDAYFARRTNWPIVPNALTTILENFRGNNIPVFDLTGSNPTSCGFSYPEDVIARSLTDKRNFKYTPNSQGGMSARQAVCDYYREQGYEVDPSRIFLTSSTSEAYSCLFRLLLNPGEGAAFPQPGYPLFSYLGDLNDAQVMNYALVYDRQWKMDFKGLDEILSGEAKVLMLVNPNNPTGSYVGAGDLQKINHLCLSRQTSIICDEVFADFPLQTEKKHVSLVENDSVLTFVLSGISKVLGLPQMKLSWIVVNGPDELVHAAMERLEIITDTYLSVNTPVQNALSEWFRHKKVIQDSIRVRLQKNLNFLKMQAASALGCELLAADGGWYAVVRIPSCQSEEAWVLQFLKNDHVLVHPGYFFDFESEAFIVISLLPDEDTFAQGVRRLFKRIAQSAA